MTAGLLFLAGCGGTTKVSDPELRQIQDMLDAQLPPGTPRTLVNQFVTTRGYPIEPSGRTDAMVVIIRHIDQQKLKPVTARVTFHFDANDKLLSTYIVRALNQSGIPAPAQPGAQPEQQQPAQPQTPSPLPQ
jgi:hypothetical protein